MLFASSVGLHLFLQYFIFHQQFFIVHLYTPQLLLYSRILFAKLYQLLLHLSDDLVLTTAEQLADLLFLKGQ